MSGSEDVVYGILVDSQEIDESNQEVQDDSLWSFWRNFVWSNLIMSIIVIISMMMGIRVYRILCTAHMLFFTIYLVYLYRTIIEEHLANMELDRQQMSCLRGDSVV